MEEHYFCESEGEIEEKVVLTNPKKNEIKCISKEKKVLKVNLTSLFIYCLF
jgi:hypothetical protein